MMRRLIVTLCIAAFLWPRFTGLNWAQEFDVVLTERNRKPFTVLDQIPDPTERKAIQELYGDRDSQRRAQRAEAFLAAYPQSWFLPHAYEIAAKAYIDLDNYPRALDHGKASLRLLPENPPLLIQLANVQVLLEGHLAEAKRSAREGLELLEQMARPSSVALKAWPNLQRQLRASGLYALGRAAATAAGGASSPW